MQQLNCHFHPDLAKFGIFLILSYLYKHTIIMHESSCHQYEITKHNAYNYIYVEFSLLFHEVEQL